MKKILASILCMVMILSSVSVVVFADANTFEVENDEQLLAAISNATDGDIIKIAAGDYTGGISVGKNITLEGSVDEEGNPTTVFQGNNDGGSYYMYSIYMNKGTIKNIKIVDAWKGIMTEGKGSLTIDNVTIVEAGYGIHIAEAKAPEDTVLIQNSNIDITWANSFTTGAYKVIFKNNNLTANNPYYGAEYGANVINTYVPNTEVSDNAFGENAKILVRDNAKDDVVIGTNYYADGFDKALSDDSADIKIETYYETEDMTEVIIAPVGTITYGYTTSSRIWGEATANAKESFVVELYAGEDKIAEASLNADTGLIDGDVYVTWGIPFNGQDSEYWTVEWVDGNPAVDVKPTKVMLWCDGYKVSENIVQMNAPDNLNPLEWEELETIACAAEVNGKKYGTLQRAIDSIGSEAGEYTITVLDDVTEDIVITQYANQKVVLTAAQETAVVLTSFENDKPIINGSVQVDGRSSSDSATANTVIKNLAFDAVGIAADRIIGVYDGTTRYVQNLTVENCDFYDSSDAKEKVAIKESTGGSANWLIKNCTAKGLHSFIQVKNVDGLVVENCIISDCKNGINLNSTADFTMTESKINVDGYGLRSGQGSVTNTPISIGLSSNIINAGEEAVILRAGAEDATLTIASGSYFAKEGYSAVSAIDDAVVEISGGAYSSDVSDYVVDGFDLARTSVGYTVIEESQQADSIVVEFREIASENEESKLYEIILKGNDDEIINELASVDLTFALSATSVDDGAMNFVILPKDDFTITRYENTNRYMFNYNGTTAFEETANEIVIATLTVMGYGEYTIGIENVPTNVVNATTVNDNLVDSFTEDGLTDDDTTTGGLIVDVSISDEITVPVRTLDIFITFPNTISYNAADYQDMTVTIVGGNVDETIKLGMEDTYSITRELPYNTAYTVTVSGAGYRTARYTVTLTEDKTLNFWNNVMDEAKVMENGLDSSAVTKNFLAGDIVKDNSINIYDLSAVVSYFAENSTVENGYAKYDLNRDGIIDSKDVAYVLVSWGE